MANTAAIRKTIDGFRELDKAIQGAAQAAEDWHRSNAMKALQLGGAPGSVLGGATAQQEATARQRKIEEAAGVLRSAEAQRRTAQKALDDYEDSSRFLGIKGMPSAGFDEAFFGTTSALRGAVSRAEVLKTQAREALQGLQTEHGEAARLAGAGVRGMAGKEHDERILAAYKAANELYDQQQREAADAARGQAETQAIIREAQSRGFMATADDRAKELRQIDDWFAEQQVRAKDHAGAMGAIQDSYHEQRAAAQKRFREQDNEADLAAWMAAFEGPAAAAQRGGRRRRPGQRRQRRPAPAAFWGIAARPSSMRAAARPRFRPRRANPPRRRHSSGGFRASSLRPPRFHVGPAPRFVQASPPPAVCPPRPALDRESTLKGL